MLKLLKVYQGVLCGAILNSRLTGQNILLGSLCIPPETSKHSCIEIFDDIEHDILELTSDKECSIIIAGDLNARIGRLSDVDTDKDQTQLEFLNYCQPVNLGSFPHIRQTQDNKINRNAQRLIKLCKSVNIYILNGRTGQDNYIGRFTSKNSSVVDIFVLKSIIELYLNQNKKLFCLFVDHNTAFDKIKRTLLWGKLLNNGGINGKILNIIYIMYSNIRSCFDYNVTLA